MPLFLCALPLSFQTFWRYLILLPFLAIAAFILSAVGSFIPLVSYLVPGAISAFLVIMGIRCALAARGHYGAPDLKQLLLASFIYGTLNLAIKSIYVLGSWGIMKIMPNLGIPTNDANTLASAIAFFPSTTF